LVGLVNVFYAVTFIMCATAEIPRDQWPDVPIIVIVHPHDDIDLIPGPIIPPNRKPLGSDPLLMKNIVRFLLAGAALPLLSQVPLHAEGGGKRSLPYRR